MGSTFRYISDSALEACGGSKCHYCECDDVPIYYFLGKIVDPSHAKDPQLAKKHPDVYELCVDCILSGNIIKDPYVIPPIEEIARAYATNPDVAIINYHTIPDIPGTLDDRDWPMCCGDWCEFQGNPSDDHIFTLHRYWDHGPQDCHFDFKLISESLSDVCLFRCLTCDKSYFIWQPT